MNQQPMREQLAPSRWTTPEPAKSRYKPVSASQPRVSRDYVSNIIMVMMVITFSVPSPVGHRGVHPAGDDDRVHEVGEELASLRHCP